MSFFYKKCRWSSNELLIYIYIYIHIYIHIYIYIYYCILLYIIYIIIIFIIYVYLTSVRFERSVCHGSLMTTYITLIAWFVEQSFVHWYQQCVTVHQVHELPQNHFDDNWEGTLFSWLHVYYAHCTSIDLSTLWFMDHFWPHLYYAPCLIC